MWWILTVLSIAGVVMNAHRMRACFAVWMVTNTGWIVYNIRIAAWEPAALFAVYLALAVYGWFRWGRL